MPKLWDKDSERLFKIIDEAGYVSWPADQAEPIVLLKELSSLMRRRGQREITPGRFGRLLYDPEAGNPMNIHEIRSVCNALGVDARLLLWDVPPPNSRKSRSLLDELTG